MDDIEERKGTGTGENGENKVDPIYRIAITSDAEDCLIKALGIVNTGFDGGKVTRHEIGSWAIKKALANFSDENMREVRAEYFDEVAVLESMLKHVKNTKSLPADLRVLLQRHIGVDDGGSRRNKK